MTPGDSTRRMVRAAMTFVTQRFPWVDSFKLTDASTFACVGSIVMDLANVSWVTYGKTYYERFFDAALADPNLARNYADDTSKLLNPDAKVPYEAFKTLATDLPAEASIRKAYAETKTYLQFFQRLKEESGERYCELIHPWVNSFVDRMLSQRYWTSYWIVRSFRPVTIAVEKSGTVPQEAFRKGGGASRSTGHFTIHDL